VVDVLQWHTLIRNDFIVGEALVERRYIGRSHAIDSVAAGHFFFSSPGRFLRLLFIITLPRIQTAQVPPHTWPPSLFNKLHPWFTGTVKWVRLIAFTYSSNSAPT